MKTSLHSVSRRQFLRSTALAGAALGFPTIVPGSVFGANAPSKRINIGLIGNGNQMHGHRGYLSNREDCQIVAVCDVRKSARDQARMEVEEKYARRTTSGTYKGCDACNEFEAVLDRADVDAVLIATPDHWHAPISIMAMRKGKDVYCQKPMTLTVAEGRIVSDIARQYGTIFQVGSQQRSEYSFRRACEIVRNGWIGKVHTIYTRLGEFPPPQELPEQPVPEGFDYDRWLGPAPWAPFNANRVDGNYGGGWRCYWEYGNRKNGDWGAHHYDIIQWALGMDDSGPVEFIPKGFKGEPYQTHVYANGTRVLREHPTRNGQMIQFIGDRGEVLVSRQERLETTPESLKTQPLGPGDIRLYASTDHEGNWIECIKTRKQPLCTAEIGHRSGTVCHLSGIAERLGRPLKWDPAREVILDDPEAGRWLDRPRRAPYTYI
jgi:predicted dehydrogenase